MRRALILGSILRKYYPTRTQFTSSSPANLDLGVVDQGDCSKEEGLAWSRPSRQQSFYYIL